VYLIHAAKQDWSAVEPAIFGTLLERALDPRERHKLGAHYTPVSYVERLVRRTVIDPLRAEWDAVKIAAAQLDDQGKTKDARAAVGEFHDKLAKIRVLDPACGSGNFLYVALELLKRLEAEVLDLFEALGGDRKLEMDRTVIRPSNFLGIELNPRAAAIAQLVLWIGYFQWNLRTTGKADTNDRPLLPKENSIECRDAVLAYDAKIPSQDPDTGEIMTIWDGRTTKPHPVTGKEVPDDSARTTLFDYVNPRRAEWPQTDFIVGNPPFIGASRMREALGDGYTESLRKAWKGDLPESADFVMFWWFKAAAETAQGRCKRFGFITTNSIHQTFNRRVIEPFVAAISNRQAQIHLAYAIPDHPWVDSADGAAVRISMTVAAPGNAAGILDKVVSETSHEDGENEVTLSRSRGVLAPNLQIGADLGSFNALLANCDIVSRGVQTIGDGFVVSAASRANFINHEPHLESYIRPYLNGKDVTNKPRGVHVIDMFGTSEQGVRDQFPNLYQYLLTSVKPLRDQNSRESYRKNWWILGEPQPALRKQVDGLSRFIVTPVTAKHRFFQFISSDTLPDQALNVIASNDALCLAVLSSGLHVCWALAAGGRLGVGNDPRYNNTRCFLPFPFPALEEDPLKQRIRDLGERLDAHRKRQQALHPELTLTGIYNVLEKLRAEQPLNDKEKKIHDDGLVTILKQIHDELDAAVLEAYGWRDLSANAQACSGALRASTANEEAPPLQANGIDARRAPLQASHSQSQTEAFEQELLKRLVALNHERATEEKRGLIRWLRPEYQAPEAVAPKPEQKEIDLGDSSSSPSKIQNQQSTIHNPQSSIPPRKRPGPPPCPCKSPPSKRCSPPPEPTPPPSPATSASAPRPASSRSRRFSRHSKGWGNCEIPYREAVERLRRKPILRGFSSTSELRTSFHSSGVRTLKRKIRLRSLSFKPVMTRFCTFAMRSALPRFFHAGVMTRTTSMSSKPVGDR
jgi:hypothetical protein